MEILIAYFSKTGYTARLARAIGDELTARGHGVVYDEIKRAREVSWVQEVLRDALSYPRAFTQVLFSRRAWKEDFFRTYRQVEEDLLPPSKADVSAFDRVLIGGPKWVYISYPVARYLKTVKGLSGKPVGMFTTFCGPPIQAFEIDMIEIPMTYAIEAQGGRVAASMGLTTGYHEVGAAPIFRLVSRILFRRPLDDFTLGSEHATRLITEFCDRVEKG